MFGVLNCIITGLGSELIFDSAYCFMQLSDSVNSNKDPVCETELHFTEKYQIVSKSFEIQFTPSCISAKTVSNNYLQIL